MPLRRTQSPSARLVKQDLSERDFVKVHRAGSWRSGRHLTYRQRPMLLMPERASGLLQRHLGGARRERLAAVIDKLTKQGVKIDRRYFKGVRAPRVAEYSLHKEASA